MCWEVKVWIDLLARPWGREGERVMGEEKRGDGAGVGIGAGRRGIGGIPMAKRGRIDDIDQRIYHVADRWTGRERGIRIEGSGREVTRGEIAVGHHTGHESAVTPHTHLDGGTPEIETTTTEDDEERIQPLHMDSNLKLSRI